MSYARVLTALAALLCGVAVALGAWAAHAAEPEAARRLAIASVFAFGHGLALIALRGRPGVLALTSRCCLFAGVLLFSGSLAAAALFATPTALAPAGGLLMMLGWLLVAADLLRSED